MIANLALEKREGKYSRCITMIASTTEPHKSLFSSSMKRLQQLRQRSGTLNDHMGPSTDAEPLENVARIVAFLAATESPYSAISCLAPSSKDAWASDDASQAYILMKASKFGFLGCQLPSGWFHGCHHAYSFTKWGQQKLQPLSIRGMETCSSHSLCPDSPNYLRILQLVVQV